MVYDLGNMCEVGDCILGHVDEYIVLKNRLQNPQHETRMRIFNHIEMIANITHVIWNMVPLRVVGFILDFWFGLDQWAFIDHLCFNIYISCALQLDLQTWSCS